LDFGHGLSYVGQELGDFGQDVADAGQDFAVSSMVPVSLGRSWVLLTRASLIVVGI